MKLVIKAWKNVDASTVQSTTRLIPEATNYKIEPETIKSKSHNAIKIPRKRMYTLTNTKGTREGTIEGPTIAIT